MVCEGLQSSGARIDDWYEDIVWANLYTVAPAGGGNPNGSLCAAQRVICGKLLKKQIEILNPTHIVFVTDWNWFTKFNQPTKYSTPLFPDIEQEKDNPIIVGRGHIGHYRRSNQTSRAPLY